MIAKLKWFAGIALILGSFWAGWKACEGNLVSRYEAALTEQKEDFQTALAQQEAEWASQLRKTVALEKERKALRERVQSLQEEISNVQFNPPHEGECRAHPVRSDNFVRLYNRAAEAGNPPAEGDQASGVPEGSDRE